MNKWSRVVIGLKSAGLFAGTIGFGSLLIKPSSPPLVFADSVKPPPSLSYSIVDDVAAELRQDSRHASRKLLEEFSRNVLEELARNVVEKLSRDVVVLTCESTAEGGSCDVYLVGTFHDSEESCKQVQTIIQSLKPEVVFLEASPSWLTAESVKKAEDEGVPRSEFRVAFEEARSYGAKVVL
ncbi:TraB family protein [Euphorbia peplus]|nr:TraB family protein [Euphorbia peplus]